MKPQVCAPILFVEDNKDDRELTLKAFKSNNLQNPIIVAKDGEQATDYLRCEGVFADRNPKDLPCLVLLDLKLPKVSGLEVLREIRANKFTSSVPVVIFTSSSEERDLIEGYRLGANSYIQKPISVTEFDHALKALGIYWLSLNELPIKHREQE